LTRNHYLPSKVGGYLKRLQMEYQAASDTTKVKVITSARVFVIEEATYDNWNGGTFGHDVVLYIPLDVFGLFRLEEQEGIAGAICKDLNTMAANVENEGFNAVRLEINDENAQDFQSAVGITDRPLISPDSLSIWKPGLVRLFISHRDTHKRQAKTLADALEPYGISSFIAHETIEPTKEWRREIMNGLETMEIMLVFLTDDFQASTWTNQEVGFALGKSIPVISLKLERCDPPGFIAHEQALRGTLESPGSSAGMIHKLLSEKLGRKERIQAGFVTAFVTSPNWAETTARFDRMAEFVKTLNEAEMTEIINGYAGNDQLHTAIYLNSRADRLLKFLKKTTGKNLTMEGGTIREVKADKRAARDDGIPF
jgi:hypothetical protein